MQESGFRTASDADLAERVARRDREAEAELFRRFASRVRLYGLRHLRDPAAADDLVQDVLLMTLESLRHGRVRQTERLASFVLGTCRHVVMDRRRGAARRERLLERFGPQLVPAPPDESADRVELARLAACLERLSERERSVVVATFHAERPAGEIGAELGLTAGNVRVVRHRALGRLRDCLEAAS